MLDLENAQKINLLILTGSFGRKEFALFGLGPGDRELKDE
jgi:hypothetical protein